MDRRPYGAVFPCLLCLSGTGASAGGHFRPGRTHQAMGTGHALACCKGVVNGPFAVINADDFYGRTAFSEIYDFLAAQTDESCYADSNEMQA